MDKYSLERNGQTDFFKSFFPNIKPSIDCNNVLNGNLLEFRLHVTNINNVLFQCIKQLSSMRINGIPIPANILIIDLNASTAWLYHSDEYLSDIEQICCTNFTGFEPECVLHYDTSSDADKLASILNECRYTKIHIDESCIVSWAKAYYNAMPKATKEDFIGSDSIPGEIRMPSVFSDYIHPYTEETNIKFKHLLDQLNANMMQKTSGAFYTNHIYAKKSLELVRMAINRVPQGNDYIILDRCAGTGNLESYLTDEELSHCVLSTIEPQEYKVLQELFGSKARHIMVADALSLDFIDNPTIRQYIDNPKCTIVLFENPPYAETMTIEWHKKKESKSASIWKSSYVVTNMKDDVRGKVKGQVTNDMCNAFIWSGFKYYLRQPTDSYIVYAPIKYWKAQHLIKKQFIHGFAFNRRHFHTNIDACIMCALWANINDSDTDEFYLEGYDIEDDILIPLSHPMPVKRINSLYSEKYYDSNSYEGDTCDGILTGLNGLEAPENVKKRISPRFSEDIIGYLVADGSGFDNPDTHSSLLVAGRYNGNGFYLRKNNYLEKLPMFCASRYITYNREWTERARIMKSADGADRFYQDIATDALSEFLLKCLLFTCLEMQNHMRTFTGSDGRFYRNEICLDDSNGETLALRDIKKLQLNDTEQRLINQWNTILHYARKCDNYNPTLTYGVYQIHAELDTSHKDNLNGKTVWDNVELHNALNDLKTLVKDYYNAEIVPTLFEYDFLK